MLQNNFGTLLRLHTLIFLIIVLNELNHTKHKNENIDYQYLPNIKYKFNTIDNYKLNMKWYICVCCRI
jgi:hypothetical protein